MDFSVTENAWKRIKQVLPKPEGDAQSAVLRIKVMGGGCSGLYYKLEPDVLRAGDKKIENNGYIVAIDLKTFLFIKGSELDYREDLMKSEFIVQNPNAKHSCGCGKSFST